MKKKVILLLLVLLAIAILVIVIFIFKNKFNVKANTYIYDKDGNEISIIEYGNMSFYNNIKSYYIQSIIDKILQDIMNKENISLEEAEKKLVTSGYKIYTSQDSKIQGELEKIYKDDNNFDDKAQSTAVVLGNNTSEVLGIIGGRNKEDSNITLEVKENADPLSTANPNRVTKFLRQPGNSITLLSIYACGLEKSIITKDSKYVDEMTTFGNWKPVNYYGYFRGEITVEEAAKCSSNIVAAKISKDIGIENSYKFLQDLGITSLEIRDKNAAAMALGGFSKGVNLLEMSTAYRTVLNDGMYKSPVFYTKILDNKNKIYMENNQSSNKVMKEEVCKIIKDIIKENIDGKELYIKTTSTSDKRDNWSNGTDSNYTISTWYGYVDSSYIKSDTNKAQSLWIIISNSITKLK